MKHFLSNNTKYPFLINLSCICIFWKYLVRCEVFTLLKEILTYSFFDGLFDSLFQLLTIAIMPKRRCLKKFLKSKGQGSRTQARVNILRISSSVNFHHDRLFEHLKRSFLSLFVKRSKKTLRGGLKINACLVSPFVRKK